MKRQIVAAAAVLAVAGIAACGGSSPITVHGTLDVTDFSISGDDCQLGNTGYSDISPGAQVTVTAPDGTVLGSGALGEPKSAVSGVDCTFPFTVRNVKGGESRYGVAVGSRNTVWFDPDQIADPGISLGN